MKTAIISPFKLPLPSVLGGGAETLIQTIIEENEKQNQLELVVFSVLNEVAQKRASSYSNSQFIYYDTGSLLFKVNKGFRKIIRKAFRKPVNVYSFLARQILADINEHNIQKVIVENNFELLEIMINNWVGPIYFHVHNDLFTKPTDRQKNVLARCHRIITVSQYIKNKLVSQFALPENQICVLNNCIKLSVFNRANYQEDRALIRKEYGFKIDDTVILYSGRIVREKGVRELTLAFKKICDQAKVKLFLVGSSWYGNKKLSDYQLELMSIIEPIKDKVAFAGYIDHHAMPKMYEAADISVVPTLYVEEAAGLVLLESMAIGLPIITTDSGGIPEYVNNECAIVLNRQPSFVDDLSAVLLELVDKPEKRFEMGSQGIKRVKRFSETNYYGEFVDIIDGN